jgi:hypothetical protein
VRALPRGSLALEPRRFDRDEFLGRDEFGQWVWEDIDVKVPLPATVHGRAGRERVSHESDVTDQNGLPGRLRLADES